MAYVAVLIDVQQSRCRRTLCWAVRCDHDAYLNAVRSGSKSQIVSASSRAATAGGLSDEGSASGTAAACIGVSISPGSMAVNRTPCADNSSFQTRVICASAALLEPYAPQRGYAFTAA